MFIQRIILLGVLFFVLAIIIHLLIIKFCWGLIIPGLFPEAVKQNLIVNSLTWWQAFKITLVITILRSTLNFNFKK